MTGRRFGILALCVAAAIGTAGIIGHAAGLRFNFTHSAPLGLWRVQAFNGATPRRGELVEVCPPDLPIVRFMADHGYLAPGNCTGTNVVPLLKPIAAVAGDRVTVTKGRAVIVNDQSLPNTQAMQTIPAWADGTYSVAPDCVWLLSTYSVGSFDSRYFGPVDVTSVRGRATTIITTGETSDMTLTVKEVRP